MTISVTLSLACRSQLVTCCKYVDHNQGFSVCMYVDKISDPKVHSHQNVSYQFLFDIL